MAYVVDASVGIKLFVEENLSEEAHALFARLTTEPPAEFHVPDLFYIECANILWKYVQRLHYSAKLARQDLERLGKLAIHDTATSQLMVDALDIAVKHGITAYDACYVALAGQLGLPLITADEKLARMLAGKEYVVHWLGNFPLPAD
ncbi:MAG: type II toxin-antitoxin system VapC family toxin [Chloroflexi bacterium]|nr:type II toxin-antitoxin system VapC family toxin [Chloroflexota bacterium]